MNFPLSLFNCLFSLNYSPKREHIHTPAHTHALHSQSKEASHFGCFQAILRDNYYGFWGEHSKRYSPVHLPLTIRSQWPNTSLFQTGINGLWQELNAVFSFQIEWFQVFSSGEHLQGCSLTLNFRLPGLSVEQPKGECAAILFWHPLTSLPTPKATPSERSTSEYMANIMSENCLAHLITWCHFYLIILGFHSSSILSCGRLKEKNNFTLIWGSYIKLVRSD